MDPAATPGVEVSPVKLSLPEARGRLYTMRGAQLMAINVTVMSVITFAYDLHERQVSGVAQVLQTAVLDRPVVNQTWN